MTMPAPPLRGSTPPHYSIPSILAIVAAIGSFMTGAALGFILAIAAIVLGLIGLLLALMPQTRGGIVSLISILAGAVGIIAAIFKLIGHIV